MHDAEIAFEHLAENMGAELASCPDFLAARLLREAYIQFCHTTECYRFPYTYTTEPYKHRYELVELPDATYVLKAEWVKCNGKRLNPIPTNMACDSESRYPTGFYTDPECMVLSPVPTSESEIKMELVLIPTRLATGIPMEIYGMHWEAIHALLLSKVFNLPQTHWRDPDTAAFYYQEYQSMVTRIRRESRKHHVPINRTTSYGGI